MYTEMNNLTLEFLSSIRASKERLRRKYEEITGEKELEKSLIQIIEYVLEQDYVA